jgi:hypothetical protein
MQEYLVVIHGQNLLLERDGVRERYGFFTSAYVKASTAGQAEPLAIEVIRENAHVRDIALNAKDDPLKLSADEVHEIDTSDGVLPPKQGLALYKESSNDAEDTA